MGATTVHKKMHGQTQRALGAGLERPDPPKLLRIKLTEERPFIRRGPSTPDIKRAPAGDREHAPLHLDSMLPELPLVLVGNWVTLQLNLDLIQFPGYEKAFGLKERHGQFNPPSKTQ